MFLHALSYTMLENPLILGQKKYGILSAPSTVSFKLMIKITTISLYLYNEDVFFNLPYLKLIQRNQRTFWWIVAGMPCK